MQIVTQWPTWSLIVVLIAAIAVLGKAADWLVDEAVDLSKHLRIPEVVIGATIVSLGTTIPEAVVSVIAALSGNPGIALGNAVGSVICDTGLILGIACLLGPIPLRKDLVNRQGWIQLGSGVLLVVSCFPWASASSAWTSGGRLPQFMGFVFLALLAVYMYVSVRWSRDARDETSEDDSQGHPFLVVGKLSLAIFLVVLSSDVLINTAIEVAHRAAVPEAVIAATIVAFGTSLPELVTAVTSVRRGHGALAIGNVIGADILNILFVAGAAAAATPAGLDVHPRFFIALFPAMLGILIIFRIGVWQSGDFLKRRFGYLLIAIYAVLVVTSYAFS